MSHFVDEPQRAGSSSLPRKLTAVGTVGEQNQLFTVYEKNWNCPDCGQENYPSRYNSIAYFRSCMLAENCISRVTHVLDFVGPVVSGARSQSLKASTI